MKKLLVFSLIALVVFSVVVYAEAENNPIVEKLGEVKEVLLSILDKLGIIAEKETTVIVEPNITVVPPEVNVEAPIVNVNPNITVSPPEVNVYPDINITLPEKDCKWENLTLKIDINLVNFKIGYSGGSEVIKLADLFVLPSNKEFTDMMVNRVQAIIGCGNIGGASCIYNVNGERCYSTRYSSNYRQIVDFCTDKFRSGINIITLPEAGTLYSLLFEMQVKPANC